MAGHSWLFRDDLDRERMLDMEERLQPVRKASFAVIILALAACGPWLGWWTLPPTILAAACFAIADKRLLHTEHPERLIFAAWAGSEVMIAVTAALTGGPTSPLLAGLAIPIVTLSARFSQRGVIIGVITAVSLQFAVAFGVDAGAVLANPPLLIVPVAIALAVAILSTALMRSDVEHRSEAVIDQLTGMLNRKALAGRVNELAQQSEITGDPVGVVVADIDNFKRVNDACGHAVGDAVLKDACYIMRKQLRAFDLSYRLGGEEFLVLVPGADIKEAAELAEQLRVAVSAQPIGGGRRITMSFGVSASRRGHDFDYEAVFAAADAALYEAKGCGRDCVKVDTSHELTVASRVA